MLFRIWCKDNNEWEKAEVRLDADGNQYHRITWMRDWLCVRPDNHIVEFSTGLKDADGKEIFQGDIVEGHLHSHWSHDIIRCEVVWNETGACFGCREYKLNRNDFYWTHKVKFSKDVKVIGNIHENIELLDTDDEGNYIVPSTKTDEKE